MLIEKRTIHRIEKIFEMLSLPLRLLDAQGVCLIPAGGPSAALPAIIPHGLNHRSGDLLIRALDSNPALFLVAPVGAPGAEDVLCMADVLIMTHLKSTLTGSGISEVYRRILRQELTGPDLASRVSEHQIPQDLTRCVMLFQLEQSEKAGAYAVMGEMVPLSDNDVLVEMNRFTVALIKDMDGIDGMVYPEGGV